MVGVWYMHVWKGKGISLFMGMQTEEKLSRFESIFLLLENNWREPQP